MSEATVERLAKLINDGSSPNSDSGNARNRRPLEIHLRIEEGWFSLFLLATVVYSTIWSVQAARWVDHLNVLSLTTLIGLVVGVLAAKQKRFPGLLVHAGVLIIGLLLAYWQTAGAFADGNVVQLWQNLDRWFAILVNNGTSEDDSIFLFMILGLGYILAYTSAWLLYRMRSPWLLIGANGVVLLINLSNLDNGFILFLIIFLVAALLLLLRFNLHESLKRWRRQGLRYSDELSWDVMQGGSLISVGILVFSWLLPSGYLDPTVSQIWNLDANPVIQLQNVWNRAISLNGAGNPSNHGNFRDTLTLGGNPNLNNELVFTYQTDGDGSQFLQLLSYETYTQQGWRGTPSDQLPLKANQVWPSGALLKHTEKQNITIVNPPGEQYPYLLGASDIQSVSLPTQVVYNQADTVVGWMGAYGKVPAGTRYTVVSTISSADINTLRSVPMPADAPSLTPDYDGPPPPEYFNPNIVKTYTQLPALDNRIPALAKNVTSGSKTMYDKAVALETYLRTHYNYNVDVHRPMDEDGVAWFLFNSGNQGFCNYFASAMAVMARSLGMPARVAVGYTNGTLNNKTHQREVFGKDAHAWTQIYFAGYGWINFQPSATFATFTRPLPNQNSSSVTGNPGNVGGPIGGLPGGLGPREIDQDSGVGGSTSGNTGLQWQQAANATLGGLILLLLFGAIIFGIWWQRLFRRYSLAAQVYGRLCVMANWAGIKLQPSQTPYECVEELALAAPAEVTTLERVGDIYVRDRWADPQSDEHPRRNGEISEMITLWKRLQPRLFLYVIRHPHFLRWLPERIAGTIHGLRQRRKSRRLTEEDDF